MGNASVVPSGKYYRIAMALLARGMLTHPLGKTIAHLISDEFGKTLFEHSEDNDAHIAERIGVVAKVRGSSRTGVAGVDAYGGNGAHRYCVAPSAAC
ncbi:hypothetical protein [Sodalis-like endosymbiont of Proechinophthirus fluctus]|uniref:hypothetical protein n=1 Tax=Sodalis-like endosymbiont of Proechinophthirus fluctus TaxID=1462730 RepID=UPI003F754B11